MNSLFSMLAASAISLADLAVLSLLTRRLGQGGGARRIAALAPALAVKLAALALAVAWLARRPGCDRRAMAVGLLAPFALFIVWQALSLRLDTRRRA